ncbi:hypothetical protein [Nonlabens tegetincola]|uniref:FEKKY domain-containing protein n=1 Tax=Nonlabens tegetincola TaxID=323273 RepID=UPI0030C8BE0E
MKKHVCIMLFLLATVLSHAQEREAIVVNDSLPKQFIVYGLVPPSRDDVKEFEDKYGVGSISMGCVIDPLSSVKATKNNCAIAAYLDQKYGTVWREEIKYHPYGLVLKNKNK